MKFEECTTKEELEVYAQEQGLKVNLKFGFKKLKEQIQTLERAKAGTSVDRVERAEQPVPEDLLFVLEQETTKQVDAVTAPISGVPAIAVVKDGQVIETVNLASLEMYCASHGLPYDTVKELIGKSWLNHDGYSFRAV